MQYDVSTIADEKASPSILYRYQYTTTYRMISLGAEETQNGVSEAVCWLLTIVLVSHDIHRRHVIFRLLHSHIS